MDLYSFLKENVEINFSFHSEENSIENSDDISIKILEVDEISNVIKIKPYCKRFNREIDFYDILEVECENFTLKNKNYQNFVFKLCEKYIYDVLKEEESTKYLKSHYETIFDKKENIKFL